jgi:hypothetical protein
METDNITEDPPKSVNQSTLKPHPQSQLNTSQGSVGFGKSMIEKKMQELERVKHRQTKELRVMLENEARMEIIREENDRKTKLMEEREMQSQKEHMHMQREAEQRKIKEEIRQQEHLKQEQFEMKRLHKEIEKREHEKLEMQHKQEIERKRQIQMKEQEQKKKHDEFVKQTEKAAKDYQKQIDKKKSEIGKLSFTHNYRKER